MTKTLKTTIMTLLVFAATTAVGLYESMQGQYTVASVMWEVIGLNTAISVGVYAVQSFWLPSTSLEGQFNWRDMLKGAIIALGNVAGSLIAANATATAINWGGIAAATGTVLVGYLIKQFKTAPTGIPPTK